VSFKSILTRTLVATAALILGAQAFAARTTTYYHTDGLGSVVAATNEAGAVLWRKDYAPFGEQIDTTPDTERQSYTGKQHDDVTGLTYFGGRYYDLQVARFMSVDPVAFVEDNTMSFNRYLYVNNNPYKYVDPDGEFLNFALKFVLDVGVNVAFNYVTTGELNVGGALKESALGLLNPAKTMAKAGRLAMAMKKADKVTPDAGKVSGLAAKVSRSSTADANRAASRAKGIPDSQLGPSGKPKILAKKHATRKRAEDTAQDRSRRGTAPEEHSNPTTGDPHFHPSGSNSREHHTYPGKGFPKNEEY
jgi:RHS repeat-associated protein